MKTTHAASLVTAMFAVAFAAASGCSDDETTATTGTAAKASSSRASSTSSSTATSANGGNGGTGGSVGGNGGGVGGGAGGGSMMAQEFCAQYETDCTFGNNHFSSAATCIANFDAANGGAQACWQTHLDNAAGDPTSVHCEHACGAGQGVPAACEPDMCN